jgi:CubicO group peptidase (beta-lactamase class C family)
MNVSVSPEARTVQIEISNDTGYFNGGDDDNNLFSAISTRLYGKTRTPITAPAGHVAPTRLSSGAQIDAYLRAAHFSGYAYLERHGQVILSKGYGMADKEHGRPNTLQSPWPIFGPNRFITALAILRLQDEHRLSVQDRVCRYISGCPGRWQPLTIEELLLDTSGLGAITTETMPGGVPEALARCKALPPAAQPGTITSGSRCNNLLLNAIVARVSGQPWASAMQQLIFGPAHMTHSGHLTNAIRPPARVQGYNAGAPIQLGNYNNYYVPIASIEDLARLDRALLSGHLLSPQALSALFAPHLHGVAVRQRYGGSHARQLAGCYECYLRASTPTTVLVADNPGDVGGFTMDNALSPEDGSIAIIARNDVASTGTDPTSVLFGLAAQLLWGK